MIISDEQVQAAFDFLNTKAEDAAKARAMRIYMEEFRKTVKSNCMKKHEGKPIAAQERDAYSDLEYQAHLRTMREAIATDEWHRWMQASSVATIEAWRTFQANRRGEQKVG